MSKYIFGAAVSHYGVASNNRGESSGNMTNLKKVLWKGNEHTTVSAGAQKFAIRDWLYREGYPVNRYMTTGPDGFDGILEWEKVIKMVYPDTDLLGIMITKKKEKKKGGTTNSKGKGKKGKKGTEGTEGTEVMNPELDVEVEPEGDEIKGGGLDEVSGTQTRRAAMVMNNAISLDAYEGCTTFNIATAGAQMGEQKDKTVGYHIPFSEEIHATRYQYIFGIDIERLIHKPNAEIGIRGACMMSKVGGSQSRYSFDFSPENLVLQLTDRPCPRTNYIFEHDDKKEVSAPKLLQLLESGDLDPSEIYCAGPLFSGDERLKNLGVKTFPSVDACVDEVCRVVNEEIGI